MTVSVRDYVYILPKALDLCGFLARLSCHPPIPSDCLFLISDLSPNIMKRDLHHRFVAFLRRFVVQRVAEGSRWKHHHPISAIARSALPIGGNPHHVCACPSHSGKTSALAGPLLLVVVFSTSVTAILQFCSAATSPAGGFSTDLLSPHQHRACYCLPTPCLPTG